MKISITLILIAIILFFINKKYPNQLFKKISFLLFGLAVIILAGHWTGIIDNSEKIKVSTELVKRNDIVELVSASGKIQPEVEVKLSSDVSGEIVRLLVIEGDQVIEGDLLLEIKPDIYLSILERSQAALNTAKANLLKAEAQFLESESNYHRNQILFEIDAISRYEFEQIESVFKVAELNVESAKYSVESAGASLKEAQENLDKTSIYAPVEGTISKLNVELGERVVGTGQMAGTEILRLANLNAMEVVVEVNENDIIRINKNDTAIIEVDAFLKKEFKGIVTEIANSANVTGVTADQVTNFQVKISIIDSSFFLPGMTATVDIQTNKVKNVLSLPLQAVTTRQDKESSKKVECVFLYKDQEAKLTIIETGIQDVKNIQILYGIKEGERVIIGPYSALSESLEDGIRVKEE